MNGDKHPKREIPSVLEMMLHLAADNEDLQDEKNFRDHMTTFVATVTSLIIFLIFETLIGLF